MEIIIIGFVAALASLLTFFSGFGLGTILTPVLVIFFPPEVAIALTGIVHLLNNLFKISLVGKNIDWKVGLKFGILGMIGAFIGAQLLTRIPQATLLFTYSIGEKNFEITLLKLIIAILMIIFALFEVIPVLKKIQFKENKLYAGGLISGFFGGLSGNQGALRSAFLIRAGLSKENFIATGIMIACLVDFTRLSVYFNRFLKINIQENLLLLTVAILSAFAGAFIGSKALKKVTYEFIQWTVAVMIILLALALGTGII
jgi:uncharacterized membrane protein YfcA